MRGVIDAIRSDLSSESLATVPRVACLDGIRGLAALMVALDHMSCYGYYLVPGCDLTTAGGPPVAMFFVLSSFLLSVPFLTRPKADLKNPVVWQNYAIRRFLRIYPLFSVALLVYAAPQVLGAASKSLAEAMDYVLGHLVLARGEHIFWAVHVEFKYYFVLPLIVAAWFFVFRQKTWLALIVCLAIAIVTFRLFPPEDGLGQARILGLATYVSVFLMGMICAIIHARIMAAGGIQSKRTKFVLELVALLALGILVLVIPSIWSSVVSSTFSPNAQPWRWYFWGLISAVFLLSQLHGSGSVRTVLTWKPIRVLGLISFSLYLCHYPVLWLCVKARIPVGPTGLLVAALVICVSLLSYLCVERPFLRLGRKLCRRTSSPIQASRLALSPVGRN